MDMDVDLYDRDFVEWTRTQAALLRSAATGRPNVPIDWEHVAEELEDLGKRDRRDLESRLRTIVRHLLKLQYSPAMDTRAGWMDTIEEARSAAELILRDSPSLRREVAGLLPAATEHARGLAERALRRLGDADAASRVAVARRHKADQVLGDWWP